MGLFVLSCGSGNIPCHDCCNGARLRAKEMEWFQLNRPLRWGRSPPSPRKSNNASVLQTSICQMRFVDWAQCFDRDVFDVLRILRREEADSCGYREIDSSTEVKGDKDVKNSRAQHTWCDSEKFLVCGVSLFCSFRRALTAPHNEQTWSMLMECFTVHRRTEAMWGTFLGSTSVKSSPSTSKKKPM